MRILILATILFSVSSARLQAQLTIPIDKGTRPTLRLSGESPLPGLQQRVDSFRRVARDLAAYRLYRSTERYQALQEARTALATPDRPTLRYDDLGTADERRNVDDEIAPAVFNFENAETDRAVQLLNQTSQFQPIVNGGLNDLLSSGNSEKIGALALGLQYRFSPFRKKIKSTGLFSSRINSTKRLDSGALRETRLRPAIDPHYLYAAFNLSSAKSGDSANLLKTILFPELASSDFVLGWYNTVTQGDFVRGWRAEATLTTYRDTANKKLFRSESLLFGYHVAFQGNIPGIDVPAGLRALFYGNVINIDPKYNAGLHAMLPDDLRIHNTFFNLGLRVQTEINRAVLFFNGKYILNRHGDVTNPDLVRFVYTIGAAVSL